jgi:hypothetical protein
MTRWTSFLSSLLVCVIAAAVWHDVLTADAAHMRQCWGKLLPAATRGSGASPDDSPNQRAPMPRVAVPQPMHPAIARVHMERRLSSLSPIIESEDEDLTVSIKH